MKISSIIVEITGKGIRIYKAGGYVMAVTQNGRIEGYEINGKFFDMACSVVTQAGTIGSLSELDVLSEILASVAEGDLTS